MESLEIKNKWYVGKHIGYPYFLPVDYCPYIFSKSKRKYRLWNYKLFGYRVGTPIKFVNVKLGWKDKFGTPRFEWAPFKALYFFGLMISVRKVSNDPDQYWEQYLWIYYYSYGDIKKAEETWPWISDGKSTWKPIKI